MVPKIFDRVAWEAGPRDRTFSVNVSVLRADRYKPAVAEEEPRPDPPAPGGGDSGDLALIIGVSIGGLIVLGVAVYLGLKCAAARPRLLSSVSAPSAAKGKGTEARDTQFRIPEFPREGKATK